MSSQGKIESGISVAVCISGPIASIRPSSASIRRTVREILREMGVAKCMVPPTRVRRRRLARSSSEARLLRSSLRLGMARGRASAISIIPNRAEANEHAG
jgi:hypothetical protein